MLAQTIGRVVPSASGRLPASYRQQRVVISRKRYATGVVKLPELHYLEDNLAIYAQPSEDLIKRAATAGFKSMINLRFAQEPGMLANEEQLAKSAGLEYVYAPFSPAAPVISDVRKAVEKMDKIPKPILVHCAGAKRAAVVALAHVAKRDKLTVRQTFDLMNKNDINLSPTLQELLRDLVASK